MSEELSREEVRRRVRERAGRAAAPVPGQRAASKLLLADIVMRLGTSFLRSGVEKTLLRKDEGPGTASEANGKRSLLGRLGTAAAARLATRSLPGAAIVGTGLVGKLLYDSAKVRRARQSGETSALPDQSAEETDTAGT